MQGHLRPPPALVRSLVENQTRRSDPSLVDLRLFPPLSTSPWVPDILFLQQLLREIGSDFSRSFSWFWLASSDTERAPVDSAFNPNFMVGDWLAQSQVVTSVADPQVLADLTALGAVYTLSVQPPGRYTAISEGFGPAIAEFGNLTVDGPNVVFTPQFGGQSLALWEQVGDSIILVSEIDFDVNLDGTPGAATLRRVLIPK